MPVTVSPLEEAREAGRCRKIALNAKELSPASLAAHLGRPDESCKSARQKLTKIPEESFLKGADRLSQR
ncbi:MAG: hypothetical protein ACOY3L_16695 [Pseudomonadota bacterium]